MAGEDGTTRTGTAAAKPRARAKAPAKPVPIRAPRIHPATPAITPNMTANKTAAIVDDAPVATDVVKTAKASVRPKKIKAQIKTAPVRGAATPEIKPPFAQKDKIMDMASSYANGFQDVIAEAQGKAKDAFDKSTTVLGEVGEFARGNVEALVESGKILASGLQDMGSSFAAEGRSAFETMTADLKELAAAKTPADFLKIQSELVRKSFDGAVAYGSKNSEAVLKLASDAFAPISGRVSLAVEKVRTTV
jgi:phasin family protein